MALSTLVRLTVLGVVVLSILVRLTILEIGASSVFATSGVLDDVVLSTLGRFATVWLRFPVFVLLLLS